MNSQDKTNIHQAMKLTNLDWGSLFDAELTNLTDTEQDFKLTPQQTLELINTFSCVYPAHFLDNKLQLSTNVNNIEYYTNTIKLNPNLFNIPYKLLQLMYLNPVESIAFLSEYLVRLKYNYQRKISELSLAELELLN